MVRQLIISFILGSMITAFFYFIFIFSQNNKANHQPVVEEVIEPEIVAGKDVYVTDNMNDESAVILEPSTAVSYWYVYYNAHIKSSDARYTGYEVVELNTPYFDIQAAILKAIPSYKNNEDFVGIEYFKRVPFETYKSQKEN